MTDRKLNTALIVALYTIGAGLISLSITVGVGIWKASAMWTTVTNDHERIFAIIKDKCK